MQFATPDHAKAAIEADCRAIIRQSLQERSLAAIDDRMEESHAGLVLFYGGFGRLTGTSITRYGTEENGLDQATLDIMYRRLGPRAVWPKDFSAEITAPTYVLGAALDAVFDDSRLLFADLPTNDANVFVTVPRQDHGFLKGAGKDKAAIEALAAAGRWIGTRSRRG